MFRQFFHYFSVLMASVLISSGLTVASAAALTCAPSAASSLVHGEGITERTGDIIFTCTGGSPGTILSVNLSLFLNVNITNRLSSAASNTLTGISLTADNGSGPQTIQSPAILNGLGTLVFNGVTFTLSSTGSVTLTVSGLRGAANLLDFDSSKSMQVSFGFSSVALSNSQLSLGQPTHGLYVALTGDLVCTQAGSPLPQNTASFASFIASEATFTSTRVTEGYASSFAPKSDPQNLGADTGTRILVQYSGFPAGARIFVPTVVAGSDATQPTAGGDLGLTVSGGKYTPGPSSSLLLSFVPYTDANGAGGSPVYLPRLPGSGTVTLDSMSEVTLTNGSGVAVYEVVDANSSIQESAQFPTFLFVAPSGNGTSTTTSESVSLGPISTVQTATATDPIPRFQQITPPADCSIVGDCNAPYFPSLVVPESTLSYTAQAGGVGQTNYVQVQNPSGGLLQWTAAVTYLNGSGWLNTSPTQGQNDGTIRIDAIPGTLAPGTYQATLTINAGPLAGTHSVAISFVITAPTVQPPSVQTAVNAATFAAGPLTPGSIATLTGSQFSGQKVSVTFNGLPSQVLFSNATQVNLIVPAGLAGKTSAQVVVTVDGTASAPLTVNLAAFGPGIFTNGIANQDNSVNSAKQPAAPGSVIQIYATGLSGTGVITANIGTEVVTEPYYAGPAPGIPGVQQIDLILPADLTGNTVNVSVCGGSTAAQVVCSPAVAVAISQ
ncbi:MAG TPA: IPT/TIG domain-containing protein [Bryobacteraceae bacterium]|nr:IPT/TIG domain-containing protein [Bryobacteraceae bacterium]